jgi:uncharacterized protein (TIGR03118 family)
MRVKASLRNFVMVGTLAVTCVWLAGCNGGGGGSGLSGLATQMVRQTNLVSDQAGAATTDPNLVNAWGIAFNPAGSVWVADNGTGRATVYDGNGARLPVVVTIPAPGGGTSEPTGQVFNNTASFNGDKFIFATENGTIAGWQAGANAATRADASATGAIYKGLALGATPAGNVLYATNFHAGTVDIFDANYHRITMANAFVDPNLPAGFAPFGIQNINGRIYVTYAKQDANKEDDVKGPGNGFVDVFDMNGVLLAHLASRGTLNSPWGMTLAPSGFGRIGGMLLVGNFGDGTINVFNPMNGQFLGQLTDAAGHPLIIDGLWGLAVGTAGANIQNQLFFTAGPADESHGLFGRLDPA